MAKQIFLCVCRRNFFFFFNGGIIESKCDVIFLNWEDKGFFKKSDTENWDETWQF